MRAISSNRPRETATMKEPIRRRPVEPSQEPARESQRPPASPHPEGAVKSSNQPERRPPHRDPAPPAVEVRYPFWLGMAMIGWTLVGWMTATVTPHLAFVPLISVVHFLFPLITLGLILYNLSFALREIWRGS